MKIILDECLPKRLVRLIPYEHVFTVPQIGLAGYKDSELLDALDVKGIDIFITIDGNIEFQQQFKKRVFGTVVIRAISNRFQDLQLLENKLLNAIQQTTAGKIIRIP
jgi:predicted nuclease of predicted toxin-antitoxin system